eukprot:356020-Chlamydomonas_euryale.AAC.2
MHMLEALVYGACAVVALSLWGYQLFAGGVDLLKTYLAIASYAIAACADSVSFVLAMIVHRPYNLGDVLLLEDDQVAGAGSAEGVGSGVHVVIGISMRYTTLRGSLRLQTLNRHLMVDRAVRNLSTGALNDCLRIRLQAVGNAAALEAAARAALVRHAEGSPLEVSPEAAAAASTVWAGGSSGDERVLELRWTYVPDHIHEASQAKALMFAARNAVMRGVESKLRNGSLVYAAANGGAFNDKIKRSDGPSVTPEVHIKVRPPRPLHPS